jgi:hypothetical protein
MGGQGAESSEGLHGPVREEAPASGLGPGVWGLGGCGRGVPRKHGEQGGPTQIFLLKPQEGPVAGPGSLVG